MTDLQRDPIINVIQNGIKGDIEFNLAHERFRAAVILVYSGMDTMAFLGMPATQDEVTRADFVTWADRYMRFPCRVQVPGVDLYGARCAMLHSYGVRSRMSEAGKCRMVGYCDHSVPEVVVNAAVSPELVMVSIRALAEVFLAGIDRFLVDVFADPVRALTVEARLRWLIHLLPFNNQQEQT